jgi:hypothetical protein
LVRDDESTVVVYSASDRIEAQAIQNALEGAGLESLLRPFQDDNFPFSAAPFNPTAWGEIAVLEADEEKALEIIAEYLKTINESS